MVDLPPELLQHVQLDVFQVLLLERFLLLDLEFD